MPLCPYYVHCVLYIHKITMYTIYMFLFINVTYFDCFRDKSDEKFDVTTYDNDEEQISMEMEGKGKRKEKCGGNGKCREP